MNRYVAFLRAINVGGHVVRMDELRRLFEAMTFENVKTFIASGNVFFDAPGKDAAQMEKKIAAQLQQALGYEVATFIRSPSELAAIANHQPFKASDLEEGSLLVGLLPEAVSAGDKKIIATLETPVDALRVHKREVYWHARQNFAKAQFQPARMEKLLGRPATFRNITTMRKIAALMVKACLVLALCGSLPPGAVRVAAQQAAEPIPGVAPGAPLSSRLVLMRDWIDAVLRHEPGTVDAALDFPRRWGAMDLADAWVGVNVVSGLLRNINARQFQAYQGGRPVPIVVDDTDRRELAVRVRQLLRHPGRSAFLKRAALLHTDAALVDGAHGSRPTAVSSFLIPRRVIVETTDGTQDRLQGGNAHWEFARVLLDAVDNVREDPDVELWYRATLAYKLATELLDIHHTNHGLSLFPRSAEVLFLSGCLHEALADPRVQAVADEIRLPVGTYLEVKSERAELEHAEGLFRQALSADPGHVEARVRYGRTLSRLGRHQEASRNLGPLQAAGEPLVRYYAALFFGAAEEALGRHDAARSAYEQAAGLFPRAQAPRLGLSQLLHRAGDRAAAHERLQSLLERRAIDLEDEPWWTYFSAPGREANVLMDEVQRAVMARGPH